MQDFLSFWASYSITWPRCKRNFVSNNCNWCLVWTGSAFPQSFLSCKQSDAERKDFVDIPKQVVRSLSAKYRPDRYRRDKSVKFGTELP